jgi:hypothetical protein
MALRWTLLLALLSCSCGGTSPAPPPDAAPPPTGAAIRIELGGGGTLPLGSGSGFIVETAVFSLDRASLLGDRRGDQPRGEQGHRVLDLGQGPVTLEMPEAPPALYSGVRLDFGSSGGRRRDGRPGWQEMDVAFRLTGQTPGGLPFVVTDRRGLELEVRAVDGVELGPTGRLVGVVRLDVGRWLQEVTDPGGARGQTVVIEADRDGNLLRIRQNLMQSALLDFESSGNPGGDPGGNPIGGRSRNR